MVSYPTLLYLRSPRRPLRPPRRAQDLKYSGALLLLLLLLLPLPSNLPTLLGEVNSTTREDDAVARRGLAPEEQRRALHLQGFEGS